MAFGFLRGALLKLLLIALMVGCSKAPLPAESAIPHGSWRVEFKVPGGMLPVGLELKPAPEGMRAAFINGSERVVVPKVIQSGKNLVLEFPAFNSRLEGQWDGSSLAGTLTLIRRGGEVQQIPFRARPDVDYRFVPTQAGAKVDVAGRWRVVFTDDDGVETPAVGEFRQQGNQLEGTFLTETGDYRYLAGEVIGDQMLLSTFDGAHLFLFAAQLGEDNRLEGEFWSSIHWHESWIAERDAEARLADAYDLTFLKPGYDEFTFSFKDPEGRQVSLSDARFDGKVVIVTLAGTWCPNCHDEARFLRDLYATYRQRGFEVVGLHYEHFEDFDTAAEQVRRFREELGIDYTLLVAGYSDKEQAAETLPMLNRVLAFPTMIVLARDGEVRRIHTGFTGPGTGEHYTRFITEFRDYIRALLDEPA